MRLKHICGANTEQIAKQTRIQEKQLGRFYKTFSKVSVMRWQ